MEHFLFNYSIANNKNNMELPTRINDEAEVLGIAVNIHKLIYLKQQQQQQQQTTKNKKQKQNKT